MLRKDFSIHLLYPTDLNCTQIPPLEASRDILQPSRQVPTYHRDADSARTFSSEFACIFNVISLPCVSDSLLMLLHVGRIIALQLAQLQETMFPTLNSTNNQLYNQLPPLITALLQKLTNSTLSHSRNEHRFLTA